VGVVQADPLAHHAVGVGWGAGQGCVLLCAGAARGLSPGQPLSFWWWLLQGRCLSRAWWAGYRPPWGCRCLIRSLTLPVQGHQRASVASSPATGVIVWGALYRPTVVVSHAWSLLRGSSTYPRPRMRGFMVDRSVPASSCSSRASVSWVVSPGSTWPPGMAHWPVSPRRISSRCWSLPVPASTMESVAWFSPHAPRLRPVLPVGALGLSGHPLRSREKGTLAAACRAGQLVIWVGSACGSVAQSGAGLLARVLGWSSCGVMSVGVLMVTPSFCVERAAPALWWVPLLGWVDRTVPPSALLAWQGGQGQHPVLPAAPGVDVGPHSVLKPRIGVGHRLLQGDAVHLLGRGGDHLQIPMAELGHERSHLRWRVVLGVGDVLNAVQVVVTGLDQD